MDAVTLALMKSIAGGSSGSSLPSVSASDNGKVLAVKNGAWAVSEQGKKFIVTLTPTSEDFSGTMDKTVAEIDAAYEAGQEIIFKFILGATDFIEVPVTGHYVDSSYTYGYFAGYNIDLANNILIYVHTNLTNDGTDTDYYTAVYSLTPAS